MPSPLIIPRRLKAMCADATIEKLQKKVDSGLLDPALSIVADLPADCFLHALHKQIVLANWQLLYLFQAIYFQLRGGVKSRNWRPIPFQLFALSFQIFNIFPQGQNFCTTVVLFAFLYVLFVEGMVVGPQLLANVLCIAATDITSRAAKLLDATPRPPFCKLKPMPP